MLQPTAERIASALERIASAYERMATLAAAKASAPAQHQQPSDDKPRKTKGNLLTVTGAVRQFGIFYGKNGEPALTKKGKPYWKLELDNGFSAMIFREKQAAICSQADVDGAQLIVEYEKSGQYNNIENVKIAAGTAAATPPAGGEQKLSCGHLPSEQCDCAF